MELYKFVLKQMRKLAGFKLIFFRFHEFVYNFINKNIKIDKYTVIGIISLAMHC